MFIITNLTNTFSVDCTGYMHLSGAVGREFLRRPSAGVGPCCPKGNRAGDGMARFVSEEEASAVPYYQ